jgi:8-oxo-dGTP diphosphatase
MLTEALEMPVNVLLIAVLIFNLTQRRHLKHGEKKRFASLYIAGAVLLYRAELALMVREGLPDILLLPALIPPVLLLYFLRGDVFLFRLRCRKCGTRLSLKEVLYRDDPHCEACRTGTDSDPASVVPEQLQDDVGAGSSGDSSSGNGPSGDDSSAADASSTAGTSAAADTGSAAAVASTSGGLAAPSSVEDVDWTRWQARETAVLCYVFDRGKVLLIDKKTGLGKGKVNAPGGRIEEDESPEDAMVRELEEEVRITPADFYRAGELSFIFTDGYSLHGHVFFAESYRGEPEETSEASPFWVPVEEIPYGNMWEDDELWLPLALDGNFVTCRFIFDGDRMLSKQIETSAR